MITLLATLLAPALAAEPPRVWPLDGGDALVLVEDHRVPLVEIRIQIPAGTWHPWFQDLNAEEAWEAQLYDPEGALRARADALAAEISLSAGKNVSTLEARCLKEDLDATLGLIGDVLANPDYDGDELDRLKKGLKIDWEGRQKDPGWRIETAWLELLVPDPADPRRLNTVEPDAPETDGDALSAARDQVVRVPGRVIGFAGDLTPEEAQKAAADLLPAADAAPDGLEPVYTPLAAELPDAHTAEMDNLTQVYFAWGRPGPTWWDEDYPAFLIADHVLGGHFFSRLYVALRHEGGETYGVRTPEKMSHEPWSYTLQTFTRTENADATEAKLRAALGTFHSDGITQGELDGAVSALQGRLLFDQQAPGQALDAWLWERAWGLPEGAKADARARAADLSLEQVNAFIADFYDPAGFTMVRLEPAE